MEAQLKTTIHNRFDIFIKNVETGHEQQIAYAENIILDQMYTRLCNGDSFFNYIFFGTGTGTISPTRTSLFTHLGYKSVSNDTDRDAYSLTQDVSWCRRKINLGTTEYVGSTLTEIGIGHGSSTNYLVTHALIKDMNGNPISLTKTSVDIVTLYATVYATVSTYNANIKVLSLFDISGLRAYLCGVRGSSGSLSSTTYVGESADHYEQEIGIYGKSVSNLRAVNYTSCSKSADVANKKVTFTATRFDQNTGNGHIREIVFDNLCRVVLPETSIHTGLELSGANISTGDGSKRFFKLPSKNVRLSSLVIKLNGVPTAVATHNTRTINSYFSYSTLSTNGSNLIGTAEIDYAKSKMTNSTYMFTTSDNIHVADLLVNGRWQTRPYPTTPLSTTNTSRVTGDLSTNGLVAIVGHSTASEKCKIYEWTGSAWTIRPTPTTLPTTFYDAELNADGSILVIVGSGSPYLFVYDWSGSAYIKRNDPSVLPSSTVSWCSMTENGLVLAVGMSNNAQCVIVYDWSGSAWVKRVDPPSMSSISVSGVHISQNGNILAVFETGSGTYTVGHIWDWNGSSWTKRPALNATKSVYSGQISDDGTLVVCSTFDTIFSRNFQYFTYVNGEWITSPEFNYCQNSATDITGFSFSDDDNKMIFMSRSTEFYIPIFNTEALDTYIEFATPPAIGDAITADYIVDGIHKTATRVMDLTCTLQFGEVT